MADKSIKQVFGGECKGSVAGVPMLITSQGLKAEYTWSEPHTSAQLGTLNPSKGGRQIVKKDVKGPITLLPTYANAATIFGVMLDSSTGTYTPRDVPEEMDFDVILNKVTGIFTYDECFCNVLTLKGQENSPLEMILDILGKDEVASGSVTNPDQLDTMLFTDLSLSINSNTYFPKGFEWKFTYTFSDIFNNSLTRQGVMSQLLETTLSLNFDKNSDTYADIRAHAGSNDTIANVNMTFTDGVDSIVIAHPIMTVMNPSKDDDVSGVDTLAADVELKAWSSDGSTDAFTITVS